MRKSRKNIQLGDPYLASYYQLLIVKLDTAINKLGILSILEPMDLRSISSRIIIQI